MVIDTKKCQRVYSHKIYYGGNVYSDHVAELTSDGVVTLFPYECEIHSTRYYPVPIEVSVVDGFMLVKEMAD